MHHENLRDLARKPNGTKVLCKDQRAGGCPVFAALDSRFRGNGIEHTLRKANEAHQETYLTCRDGFLCLQYTAMEKRRDGQTAERQLMRRVAKGDERAFDQLYRNYHQLVFNYILRLINEPAAAEEVLQEVYLAVWQGGWSISRRGQNQNLDDAHRPSSSRIVAAAQSPDRPARRDE